MTDKQILRAFDQGRLFFGPYRAPDVRYGQELLCAVRGLCVVDARRGPMDWPVAKLSGRPSLIVCGDLERALREETAYAVSLHWDVSMSQIARWRKAMKLPRMSRAGSLVKAAQMRAKRAEHPELHVAPGHAAVSSLTKEERQRHGQNSAGDRAWTPQETMLLASYTTPEVSARANRSRQSIAAVRLRTGLRAPTFARQCKHCGHTWHSWSAKLPLKCSNPACRRRNWS